MNRRWPLYLTNEGNAQNGAGVERGLCAFEEMPVTREGPDEIRTVFDRYHGLVFRTAFRITGNAADAEDVLQTVFLRMLRRGADQTQMSSPESYLRRAAIHVSLDVIRAGKRNADVPLSEIPEPAAERDTSDLERALIAAVARLNAREAEVFALRFFEDHSNKDIAQSLGLSQIHVAVILHRARTQIRRELEAAQTNGRLGRAATPAQMNREGRRS